MVKSFKINLLDWLKTKIYVKDEIDTKLANKSDTNHNHNSTYSLLNHQHTGLDGIPDITCSSGGGQSTAGYRKVFRLKINQTYLDSPISFEFTQRTNRQTGRIHILFNSENSTDPALASFTYGGIISYPIYMYRESASTWVFISKEVSNYDTVNIRFLPLATNIKSRCTITPINEYLSTLPTSDIYTCNALLVGHKHSIANITDLQSTLDSKSNNGHTHSISDVTNLQSKLDTIPSLTSTSILVADTNNTGIINFYKFGKIAIMELNLSKVLLSATWNVLGTVPSGYMPKIANGADNPNMYWSIQAQQGQSTQLNIKNTGKIRLAYGNGQSSAIVTSVTYVTE